MNPLDRVESSDLLTLFAFLGFSFGELPVDRLTVSERFDQGLYAP
ncbi:MAG TPA: hypothetical protein VGS22_00900 [Thermoanaerobaculia bacterium]|nr:hypothetical protein [Thermoanaerobaculia bacterium]